MSFCFWRVATIGSFVAAALAIPAGALLDRWAGVDVVLVLPHSEDAVAVNRATFEAGEPVAEIYGTPVGGDAGTSAGTRAAARTRVLFPRAERLVTPAEDPSLTLLKLDKQAGDNPLQAVTVAYLAKQVALGAAAVGVVSLVLWRRSRRRAPAAGVAASTGAS